MNSRRDGERYRARGARTIVDVKQRRECQSKREIDAVAREDVGVVAQVVGRVVDAAERVAARIAAARVSARAQPLPPSTQAHVGRAAARVLLAIERCQLDLGVLLLLLRVVLIVEFEAHHAREYD